MMSDGIRDSAVTVADWQDPANLRWSFQHMDTLFPARSIEPGTPADLKERPQDLSRVPVVLPDGAESTVADVLESTDTDAWLVLHGSTVVAEQYSGTMTPRTRHLLMSVSKSLVSSVTGALVAQGLLDVESTVEECIPELQGTGYGEARIRDILDMRSGIRFSEEYLDPASEVRGLDEAVGWAPPGPGGSPTLKEFLATLEQHREHGGYFEYRSCETDVLGWVCEAAGGKPFAELAGELLWSRLGTADPAFITVDAEGTGMFDGGICATLRDLACFGAMIRDGGVALTGDRVLPADWVADIFAGGPDSTEAFAAGPEAEHMPGGRYRSQFWFLDGRPDVAFCLGIHGQMVYINAGSGVVGVKFSSSALPVDPVKGPAAAAMFDAISRHLTS